MDKNKIMQELKKAIKKAQPKNEVEDVLDNNTKPQMSENSTSSTSGGGVMNKGKKDCNCKGESEEDCECEEAAPMDKAEEVVKSIMQNFKRISDAYLAKKEGRCWEGYEPTPGKKAYSEGSCQKKNEEISKEPTLHPGQGQVDQKVVDFANETRNKKIKQRAENEKTLGFKEKRKQQLANERNKLKQKQINKLRSIGKEPKFDTNMAASEKGKK